MTTWFTTIAGSEFVWGVVLGVLLSILTAWVSQQLQNAEQKRRVRIFTADLVKNLKDYAKALKEHRERNNIIYEDYLALIEAEIGLWGRNREHMILLGGEDRREIRDYLAKAAKTVVEVRFYLRKFGENYQRIPESPLPLETNPFNKEANANLELARQKADQLISHIQQEFSDTQIQRLLAHSS